MHFLVLQVKEPDTVSVSSTSKEKPENDLAISSSKEESAVETVLPEPGENFVEEYNSKAKEHNQEVSDINAMIADFATEKTNRAKGSIESAAVSETIIDNVSTDGNNVADEGIANGGIPGIPELAQASTEDTIDTEIKIKVAEKEAIDEKGSTSANDTEDKDSPVSSSFTQETQVALPRDANEVVEDNAKRSHGVEESDNSQHEESLQSDPADLPVSRFLMDHILHQGDVPDEVGNVESKNNIEEETTSDKLMTISIQEQETFMDQLSAELVPNENKDMEKLEDTILQQDNMPVDVCDVEADNEINQKHTTDEQMGTDIQEKEAIMDSVSAQQMPEEKSTSEDRDQEKPGDHILEERIAPDDVCDLKAENIITEENNNGKNEGIIIKEEEVNMSPLSAKEIPKDEYTDQVEVVSDVTNEEQNHETKADDEKPIAKDDESLHSNICLSSTTTASEPVEIEVPGSLAGESASVVMDDYKGVTPMDQGDLGRDAGAEEFTGRTSVQDEKITASPTETEIRENLTQKDNYSPSTNVSNVSIPRDGENTRTFDNVEQIEKDAHSISEERITSAISELLGSSTTVVRREEPQTHTKYEETKLETTKITETSQAQVTENQIRNNDSLEEPEESTLEKVQLFDLLQLSRNQTTQTTTPAVTKEREQAEEATYTKVKKEKTNEEKDEKVEGVREEAEEEHTTDNNAAVIVEAREAELKPAHKKSHNILSGVGSKVKHSIAKVKKAITGKSSHHKTISPKKATT